MSKGHRPRSIIDLYHVMLRGNNKSYIFNSNSDKDKILSLLYEQVDDAIQLYAWCVMDNHIHIVISCPYEILPKIITNLTTRYAFYYKREYGTSGHTFQGRYLSEGINDESYLLQVIKYVHNNPLKAKLTMELTSYKWCSYKWYLKGYSTRLSINILSAYFNHNINKLIEFHQIKSYFECLEDKSDLVTQRLQHGQDIIKKHLAFYGYNLNSFLYNNPTILNNLISELATDTKLTTQQICQLTDQPYSLIQKICKNARKKTQ